MHPNIAQAVTTVRTADIARGRSRSPHLCPNNSLHTTHAKWLSKRDAKTNNRPMLSGDRVRGENVLYLLYYRVHRPRTFYV